MFAGQRKHVNMYNNANLLCVKYLFGMVTHGISDLSKHVNLIHKKITYVVYTHEYYYYTF